MKNVFSLIFLLLLSISYLQAQQVDEETLKKCHKAAKKGDTKAMNELANYYYWSFYGVQNHTEALKWAEHSAKKGDTYGMVALAGMYERGGGIPKDIPKMLKWYQKVAELGNSAALHNLGIIYAEGNVVGQSKIKAKEFLDKAYVKAGEQKDTLLKAMIEDTKKKFEID